MAMKFAVLGTGHWAAQTHAVAVAAHPGAELVAVWGRDRAKAAAVAEPHGARGYDDLDAALAEVDAVAIALPPNIQAPLAVRAARAGKHLLLDKPLALDIEAADDVVRAVDESGVANLIFFTSRYVPEIERFLVDQAGGDWDSARIAMLGSIIGDDNPYRDSAWRYEYGGLWDLGPHALSLLVPVLGPVVSVVAAVAPHGVTHVIANHSGGGVSTMALSVVAPIGRHEFVFSGPTGEVTPPVSPAEPVDPVRSLGVAIDELLEQAGSGRRDHPCDVHFGRNVTAVLASAQRARDEGVRVNVIS
jgi:predicted dehydrogenase